jgi:hypothetical protein
MKEKCSTIKGTVCNLLNTESKLYKPLCEGETQTLKELLSFIDSIILGKVNREAKKECISVDSYISIKLIGIKKILEGYNSKELKELISLLNNFCEK